MPVHTKVFRLFVSSTFTDMRKERNLLLDKVLPKLEELCAEYGAQFQIVDLRWGVNEESQFEQSTIGICLEEIRRCQRLTPKPNFLILLGDRYGWQPIPSKISFIDFSEIMEKATHEEQSLIGYWYLLDENSIPSEYVLKSRDGEERDQDYWVAIESKLRAALRKCTAGFTKDRQTPYSTSATHQEILVGALGTGNEALQQCNPSEHVLACFREIRGIPSNSIGYVDLDETGKEDVYSKNQLEVLRSDLRSLLGDHVYDYTADWKEGSAVLQDEEAFVTRILSHFAPIIQDAINSEDKISANIEADTQKEFLQHLSKRFHGRSQVLEAISRYGQNPQSDIFWLIGESGSGKSSVMARAIENAKATRASRIVIYRFVGASLGASYFMGLIYDLCVEICGHYDTNPERIFCEGYSEQENVQRREFLKGYLGLAELFRVCLGLSSQEKPLVIFFDAIDQLAKPHELTYLLQQNSSLPPYTSMIVSTTPELELSSNKGQVLRLGPMPESEASVILESWLKDLNPPRQLTDKQKQRVLNSFKSTGLPFHLRLAYEIGKKWRSFDSMELKDNIEGIINDFLFELETAHSKITVKTLVSHMLCGRHGGLTEKELMAVLEFDQKHWATFVKQTHKDHVQEIKTRRRIPSIIWSRLFLDLADFLAESSINGSVLIRFFHSKLINHLSAKYIDDRQGIHKNLVKVFLASGTTKTRKSYSQLSDRSIEELPYHITQSNFLVPVLGDPLFLEQVYSRGKSRTFIEATAGVNSQAVNSAAALLSSLENSSSTLQPIILQTFVNQLRIQKSTRFQNRRLALSEKILDQRGRWLRLRQFEDSEVTHFEYFAGIIDVNPENGRIYLRSSECSIDEADIRSKNIMHRHLVDSDSWTEKILFNAITGLSAIQKSPNHLKFQGRIFEISLRASENHLSWFGDGVLYVDSRDQLVWLNLDTGYSSILAENLNRTYVSLAYGKNKRQALLIDGDRPNQQRIFYLHIFDEKVHIASILDQKVGLVTSAAVSADGAILLLANRSRKLVLVNPIDLLVDQVIDFRSCDASAIKGVIRYCVTVNDLQEGLLAICYTNDDSVIKVNLVTGSVVFVDSYCSQGVNHSVDRLEILPSSNQICLVHGTSITMLCYKKLYSPKHLPVTGIATSMGKVAMMHKDCVRFRDHQHQEYFERCSPSAVALSGNKLFIGEIGGRVSSREINNPNQMSYINIFDHAVVGLAITATEKIWAICEDGRASIIYPDFENAEIHKGPFLNQVVTGATLPVNQAELIVYGQNSGENGERYIWVGTSPRDGKIIYQTRHLIDSFASQKDVVYFVEGSALHLLKNDAKEWKHEIVRSDLDEIVRIAFLGNYEGLVAIVRFQSHNLMYRYQPSDSSFTLLATLFKPCSSLAVDGRNVALGYSDGTFELYEITSQRG